MRSKLAMHLIAPGLALAGLLLLPRSVYGYLDPGTGSFIIQIVIAALLGGLMAMKRTWAQIASRGRRLLRLGPDDGAKDD